MFSFAVPLFVGSFHHCCYCRLPINAAASAILVPTVQVSAGHAYTGTCDKCMYWYFIDQQLHTETLDVPIINDHRPSVPTLGYPSHPSPPLHKPVMSPQCSPHTGCLLPFVTKTT